MIPAVNQSGVLPPFIPEFSPTDPAQVAPYKVSIVDFVSHYATSQERIKILKGFLLYRSELRRIGIVSGFQWVDGSFVEDVESIQNRAPNDIDLVTFASRPVMADWNNLVYNNLDLFHPKRSKSKFICDAYYVDLNLSPIFIVEKTRYWFGLFSHQRESYLWKGMLEIPLEDNDDQALELLEGGVESA